MWQRFTERARKVVFYAQEEAGRLGENYVSTEHLLLGLIREGDGLAARVLSKLGVDLERTRHEVRILQEAGDKQQPLPFPVSTDFWSRMTDDLQEVVRRLIDVPRAPMEKGNVPLRLLQLLIASGPNAAVARINRTGLDHSAIASILSDCPLSMTSEPAVESYLEAAWIVQCAYGHARAFGWRKADTDHAMIAALEEVERQGGPLAEELSAQGLTTDRLIESPRLKPAEDAETVEAAPTEPVRASEVDVLSTRLLAMQSAALKLLTDANSAATKLDKLLKHGARETEGD